MSLTSYRAAPPRANSKTDGLEDLAATYSPTPGDAVPWALGFFTAGFGRGSGAGPPPKPPGHPAHPSSGLIEVLGVCCCGPRADPKDKLRMISMHGAISSSIGRLGPVSSE